MFDASAFLLQNTVHSRQHRHSLMSDACDTFRRARCISSLQHAQGLLLFKQTVDDLYLPVFRYTAVVDFTQQPGHTNSAQHLMLKFQ